MGSSRGNQEGRQGKAGMQGQEGNGRQAVKER
jgi:hypothetical protein